MANGHCAGPYQSFIPVARDPTYQASIRRVVHHWQSPVGLGLWAWGAPESLYSIGRAALNRGTSVGRADPETSRSDGQPEPFRIGRVIHSIRLAARRSSDRFNGRSALQSSFRDKHSGRAAHAVLTAFRRTGSLEDRSTTQSCLPTTFLRNDSGDSILRCQNQAALRLAWLGLSDRACNPGRTGSGLSPLNRPSIIGWAGSRRRPL